MGWSTGGPPTALVKNGTLISKPKEVAECLSEFFDTKIKNLKRSIPQNNEDPCEILRNSMRKWKGAEFRREFKFRDATLLEIIQVIGKLSNSSSMGHDLLDPLTLKLVTSSVAKPKS